MKNLDQGLIDTWIVACLQGRMACPPATLYQVIAADPGLRGALMAGTIGDLVGGQRSISCHGCRAQISALADWEQTDTLAAWRTYGASVGHLMICADCAEIYAQVRQLMEIDTSLPLIPKSGVSRYPARLQVERSTLTLFSSAISTMAQAHRGSDQPIYTAEPQILADQTLPDGTIARVFLTPSHPDMWRLTVTTTPPRQGMMEVAFAQDRFQIEFNGEGVATLEMLPAQLVLSPSGPSLSIHF